MRDVLGSLDTKTRLVIEDNSYILEEKIGNNWDPIYYYSTLAFALSGYIKLCIAKPKRNKQKSAVEELLRRLEGATELVESFCKKLDTKIRQGRI